MWNIPLASKRCGSLMREMAGTLIGSTKRPRCGGDFHIVSKVYGTETVTGSAGPQ
jgi:hypothetical protein